MSPKIFILDVDGVMTDGRFYYSSDGKIMKVFGADDNDALSLLEPYLDIHFVTGDHRGFEISKSRIVDDMKRPLHLVSTIKRIDWIKEKWDLKEVIYMGDGIFDHYVFKKVAYCIAPANGDEYVKSVADFITKRSGANRAVAEASLHILENFFKPYILDELPNK
ncbi:putative 3-deoxy-D-manno-octulosonate 8-phosphate phosphatase [Candidatus Ruthia magnifica str. Cm (Calyptogena magnifica)]|uniref:3-deoxy-D-manno-octulosonate 8-phosphate phosphatase n=1 Tax=Ruthia magnifica subsp. Calyptogena magnifica TaxID=413404 RepID=A1AXF7_RUTMC|nr:HAD hydrolase family protein [Candidatus Ruthturnera calyptogenae]ABL02614.1 putative 3-deoxy-D-manno-octulosonate 8-phosphate phosphatase [Candidatus Ruthia magnifica str. Cm (Calyptogena magnifica)]